MFYEDAQYTIITFKIPCSYNTASGRPTYPFHPSHLCNSLSHQFVLSDSSEASTSYNHSLEESWASVPIPLAPKLDLCYNEQENTISKPLSPNPLSDTLPTPSSSAPSALQLPVFHTSLIDDEQNACLMENSTDLSDLAACLAVSLQLRWSRTTSNL